MPPQTHRKLTVCVFCRCSHICAGITPISAFSANKQFVIAKQFLCLFVRLGYANPLVAQIPPFLSVCAYTLNVCSHCFILSLFYHLCYSPLGSMVAQWLALLPNSNKALGQNPMPALVLYVLSLHASYGDSGFPNIKENHQKNMHIRLITTANALDQGGRL